MRNRDQFAISLHAPGWKVLKASPSGFSMLAEETSGQSNVQEMARKARAILDKEGYSGQPVLLAIPSAWCLCATVSTEGLPRKSLSHALAYRLEEKFPIAVEEFAACFLRNGVKALGIAAIIEKIRPCLIALKECKISIANISPEALLACQSVLADLPRVDPSILLLETGQHIEIFLIHGGWLEAWKVSNNDPGEVLVQIQMLSLQFPGPAIVRGHLSEGKVLEALAGCPDIQFERVESFSLLEASGRAAYGVLCGRLNPWVDFRQGLLGESNAWKTLRAPLFCVAVATLLFFVALTATLTSRARNYGELTSQHEHAQAAIFSELLAGQPIPVNVKSRLASEERRLQGLKGSSQQLPQKPSALLVLHRTFQRLPVGLRYRLLEMNFEGEKLYLEGQAKSHADADSIAASLRKDAELRIESPRTEQLTGKGVSFTITGTFETPNDLVKHKP